MKYYRVKGKQHQRKKTPSAIPIPNRATFLEPGYAPTNVCQILTQSTKDSNIHRSANHPPTRNKQPAPNLLYNTRIKAVNNCKLLHQLNWRSKANFTTMTHDQDRHENCACWFLRQYFRIFLVPQNDTWKLAFWGILFIRILTLKIAPMRQNLGGSLKLRPHTWGNIM